jgi:hypothetical protein
VVSALGLIRVGCRVEEASFRVYDRDLLVGGLFANLLSGQRSVLTVETKTYACNLQSNGSTADDDHLGRLCDICLGLPERSQELVLGRA